MRIAWAVALSVGLTASAAAQDAPATEEKAARDEKAFDSSVLDEEPVSARRPLRVLRHPYEISSFYRSGDQRGSFHGDASLNPYALPGYYRSAPPSGGYGYEGGAFGIGGMSGYAPLAPTTRRRFVRRPLGHNGEWWLLAPGFLAPIGPLTGADWSR